MPTDRLLFAAGVAAFAIIAALAATLFAIERPTPAVTYLRGLLRRSRP